MGEKKQSKCKFPEGSISESRSDCAVFYYTTLVQRFSALGGNAYSKCFVNDLKAKVSSVTSLFKV